MLKRLTENMEQRQALIEGSMSKERAVEELAKCNSLKDFYDFSVAVKRGVFAQMEWFVFTEQGKVPVEFWNTFNFTIRPHVGKGKIHYGKEDVFTPRWGNVPRLMASEKERYERSVKITSIAFVLDEIDGDFSVTFNFGAWAFISGAKILDYYSVIKKYLDGKELQP
jgi:hypothetical protein